MEELRCQSCKRKLAEANGLTQVSIKCHRCKTVNLFSMAQSALSAQSHVNECRRASTTEGAHVCKTNVPYR